MFKRQSFRHDELQYITAPGEISLFLFSLSMQVWNVVHGLLLLLLDLLDHHHPLEVIPGQFLEAKVNLICTDKGFKSLVPFLIARLGRVCASPQWILTPPPESESD